MQKWQIRYWNGNKGTIVHWFDNLTSSQLKSVAKELKMLELVGNELRMPHSKALGKGLFELRERSYGFRIYYGFYERQIIILLAAGDKKSQDRDIKIAYSRFSKLKMGENIL